MTNKYLEIASSCKIIVMYHDEPIFISVNKDTLQKAMLFPGTWKIKMKGEHMHIYQNIQTTSGLTPEISVYLKDLVLDHSVLEEVCYLTSDTTNLLPENLLIKSLM